MVFLTNVYNICSQKKHFPHKLDELFDSDSHKESSKGNQEQTELDLIIRFVWCSRNSMFRSHEVHNTAGDGGYT